MSKWEYAKLSMKAEVQSNFQAVFSHRESREWTQVPAMEPLRWLGDEGFELIAALNNEWTEEWWFKRPLP